MASIINGNTFYIDAVSSSTAMTYLQDKDLQTPCLIFNPSAAGDTVTINDMAPNSVSAGPIKMFLKSDSTAAVPIIMYIPDAPIRFPNGIWISQLSASSNLTIIFNRRG